MFIKLLWGILAIALLFTLVDRREPMPQDKDFIRVLEFVQKDLIQPLSLFELDASILRLIQVGQEPRVRGYLDIAVEAIDRGDVPAAIDALANARARLEK